MLNFEGVGGGGRDRRFQMRLSLSILFCFQEKEYNAAGYEVKVRGNARDRKATVSVTCYGLDGDEVTPGLLEDSPNYKNLVRALGGVREHDSATMDRPSSRYLNQNSLQNAF